MNKFDLLYKNDNKGWGMNFRRSQLYRFKEYYLMLCRNNVGNLEKECMDVACWDGYFAGKYLQTLYKNVKGVDISDKAINEARKKYPNIGFEIDKLPDLGSIIQKYYLISMNECIYYLNDEDRIKAIKRVYDCIEKNGYLMISVNIGKKPYFSKQEIRELIGDKFEIIDSQELCYKKYYDCVETKLWQILELTSPNYIRQKHEYYSLKGKIAFKIIESWGGVHLLAPTVNWIVKLLLYIAPISIIDKWGHLNYKEDNVMVYFALCKKI